MIFQEFCAAVESARSDVRKGDQVIREFAELAAGRLRLADVPSYVLADLKRELNDFNMKTMKWKER